MNILPWFSLAIALVAFSVSIRNALRLKQCPFCGRLHP